jgi:Cys-tRNA(Pro)/Cys-tRNA(Cys) deacylase
MTKTNAVRLLDLQGIKYELVTYQVDETDLSATTVAAKIGADIDYVYKTLILRGDKTGVLVAVIPGNAELNLKKAAKISGNKNVEMIAMKEILELTGYVRGGCSPVGMKKKYPTFIHEDCQILDYIYVSAGMRGLQMKLNPQDLISAVPAEVADLV